MRKANTTIKALLGLTLFFVLLAILSFAAFRQTEVLCTGAVKNCSGISPAKGGGKMLWDDFSRHFITFASPR
jgi:hypothetical protein